MCVFMSYNVTKLQNMFKFFIGPVTHMCMCVCTSVCGVIVILHHYDNIKLITVHV